MYIVKFSLFLIIVKPCRHVWCRGKASALWPKRHEFALSSRHKTYTLCCWSIAQISWIYFRGYWFIYVINKVYGTKLFNIFLDLHWHKLSDLLSTENVWEKSSEWNVGESIGEKCTGEIFEENCFNLDLLRYIWGYLKYDCYKF